MTIPTSFIHGAEAAKTRFGPELARALETALTLSTGGFNRSAANGPAPLRNLLVVRAFALPGEIGLRFAHGFAAFSTRRFELPDFLEHHLFLAVAELMQPQLTPAFGRLLFSAIRQRQFVEMFARVIKIQ